MIQNYPIVIHICGMYAFVRDRGREKESKSVAAIHHK